MQRNNNFNPFDRSAIERVDAGVMRNVMMQVYLWMTMAMLTTLAVSVMVVETGFVEQVATNPIILFGAIIGELGLVFWLSARLNKMAVGQAITLFFAYSALNGVTLSLILIAYTTGSIASAFATTSLLFGAMSIYGATTNADLTKLGTYLFMGLIGLIIAIIVNLFLGSALIDFMISLAGVVIFTGLTATDTQKIARMAGQAGAIGENDNITRVAIMGALILYLDFINLFIFLLRLMGNRR